MQINTNTTLAPLSPAGSGQGRREKDHKLRAACQDFEAIFWHHILRQMRRSIPHSGFLGGGMGEEIFQDFLDEEYARLMTREGAGSLAAMLYEQLR